MPVSYLQFTWEEKPMSNRRKILKSGDSFAVTLPKWWFHQNGLTVGDEVFVEVQGRQCIVKAPLKKETEGET